MPRYFVVMGRGHGKSRYHRTLHERLVEADKLIDCRGTAELGQLRDMAKTTGEWVTYDTKWASMLSNRLEDDNVLMLPSRCIGDKIPGCIYLDTLVLDRHSWTLNMAKRGVLAGSSKYIRDEMDYRELADESNRTYTNGELEARLLSLISGLWMT